MQLPQKNLPIKIMAINSVLDKIHLDLIHYLNFASIRPYLKRSQLLTDEELEKLDVESRTQTTRSTIETFIRFLKRKGPCHGSQFLSILKDSMNHDHHEGHVTIISALEEALTHQQSMETKQDLMEKDFIHVQKIVNPTENDDNEYHRIAALRCKVVKATSDIKMKFARLVLDVYRLLTKKKVPVEEIRMTLLYLGCFKDMKSANEQCSIIFPSHELSQATTVQSLIECLHHYSSWYNYGLIKFIATEFGGEDGVLIIDEYMKNLSFYCEKIIAYQCPEFSLADGIPPGYDDLVVKVDWDHLSRNAQDIAMFQAELSNLLNLKPEVFVLKSVEEGCLLIRWVVPQSVIPHVVVECMNYQKELAGLDVLTVIAAGKFIDLKRVDSADTKKLDPISFPSIMSGGSSESSLSAYTDTCTPIDPFSTATMTADELEIVSVYSGRSRHSVYSESQLFSGSITDASITKQFHSEFNILQHSPVMKISRINSLPTIDRVVENHGKTRRARTLFKSIIPKIFRFRSLRSIHSQNRDKQKKDRHGPREECNASCNQEFPILDLSAEPLMRKDGSRTYSHYYCGSDDENFHNKTVSHPLGSSPQVTPLAEEETSVSASSGLDVMNEQVMTPLPEKEFVTYTSEYCFEKDVNLERVSGIDGNQLSLTTTTSEGSLQQCTHCDMLPPMQYIGPYTGGRRHSAQKFTTRNPNSNFTSPRTSCERVDTPSTLSLGYEGSLPGTCSRRSSNFEVSSPDSGYWHLPMGGASSYDLASDHRSSCARGYSSLKRSSLTTTNTPSKETTRSNSFNGRLTYTIHHAPQEKN